MECCGQAEGGVVVAGGLVLSHCEAPPLLEAIEAAFDDVASAVAFPLLGPKSMGLPGFLRRWAIWSSRSGIVTAIWCCRRQARLALEG